MSARAMRSALRINGRVIPFAAVRALGRFNPDRPTGYQAQAPYAVDAPVRATRAEAMGDCQREEDRRGSVPSLFELLELEDAS